MSRVASALREAVHRSNQALVESGLVTETFGNVSGVDRVAGLFVIKPSGVPYEELTPANLVAVSLGTGRVLEGDLRPSSDTPTHLVLYRAFKEIGGIVHTHSLYATAWAQAQREIPALGTTHADYFCGPVPCARALTPREIKSHYEVNTGRVIVERFNRLDPLEMPAVLVAGHAPFAWGPTVEKAVENAVVLECVAKLASETLRVNPRARPISRGLLEKHFFRKHGNKAYYGQQRIY